MATKTLTASVKIQAPVKSRGRCDTCQRRARLMDGLCVNCRPADVVDTSEDEPEETPEPEVVEKAPEPVEAVLTNVHRNGSAFTAQRPGVVATIIGILSEASEEAPLEKEQVVEAVLSRLPDRDPDKTKATVGAQLGWAIFERHHIPVHSRKTTGNRKGYWIGRDGEVPPAVIPRTPRKPRNTTPQSAAEDLPF